MNKKVKPKLRQFFVCNHCRHNCDHSHKCSHDIERGNLFPRKQNIGCLGPHCDEPCDLQKTKSDLETRQLINLVLYLGEELNGHLIKD